MTSTVANPGCTFAEVENFIRSPARTVDELTTLTALCKAALESGSYDDQMQRAFAAGVSAVDAAEKAKLER